MLPPLSPRRIASRRQLSRTSAMTARTSSRSTPTRLAISEASSSACCATSATAPIPARVAVSSGPRSLAGTAVGSRCAALAAAFALGGHGSGGGRRCDGCRPRGGLGVSILGGFGFGFGFGVGDLLRLFGERTADGGDTRQGAEVVAAAGKLGLALLERRDERRGQEDRGVRTR